MSTGILSAVVQGSDSEFASFDEELFTSLEMVVLGPILLDDPPGSFAEILDGVDSAVDVP